MFKKRYGHPGTAPATLKPRAPGEGLAPVLRLVEYDGEHLEERQIASVAELPAMADDGRVRWIELNGLGDVEVLRHLGEKYHLHPLALEDVLNTGQRPKCDRYDDYLFIVTQMVYRDQADHFCGEQVSFFLRPNLLITVQEERHYDVFDPVRARLRGGRGFIRKQKADYLAYALIDAIVDHCFPLLETIGDTIEELENEIMRKPSQPAVHRLHQQRRTLMYLRRFVWPERDVVSALLHDESGLVADQTKIYLRDCYDHTVQIMDLIESYREVASGLMEIYLSSVSLRTGEIMRVLTVISAIFIPLTFVAGIFGMNFSIESPVQRDLPLNMPELYHPFGYIGSLLLMAAIAIGQLIFFKRKKWL